MPFAIISATQLGTMGARTVTGKSPCVRPTALLVEVQATVWYSKEQNILLLASANYTCTQKFFG